MARSARPLLVARLLVAPSVVVTRFGTRSSHEVVLQHERSTRLAASPRFRHVSDFCSAELKTYLCTVGKKKYRTNLDWADTVDKRRHNNPAYAVFELAATAACDAAKSTCQHGIRLLNRIQITANGFPANVVNEELNETGNE